MRLRSITFTLMMVALFAALQAGAAVTSEDVAVDPAFEFHAFDTQLIPTIEATLQAAKKDNTRALFVFGAQWCHDSVGLAKKFSTPEMQAILSRYYTTLFIDVGYLEDRRGALEYLGYPTYFGTPTILVIDPVSRLVVNKESLSRWQSADSVPLDKYIEYFSAAAHQEPEINWSKEKVPQDLLLQYQQFQDERVQILSKAYETLSPLLEADDKAEGQPSEAFMHLWREVRSYRYTLQTDLITLEKELVKHAQEGDNSPLVLPEYPTYSWQK